MPRPTMQTVQTMAVNTVSRFRFFSTTDEPDSEADAAPPNIDDRPPPLPRCSRMSTTRSRLVTTSSTLRTSSIDLSGRLDDRRRTPALGPSLADARTGAAEVGARPAYRTPAVA